MLEAALPLQTRHVPSSVAPGQSSAPPRICTHTTLNPSTCHTCRRKLGQNVIFHTPNACVARRKQQRPGQPSPIPARLRLMSTRSSTSWWKTRPESAGWLTGPTKTVLRTAHESEPTEHMRNERRDRVGTVPAFAWRITRRRLPPAGGEVMFAFGTSRWGGHQLSLGAGHSTSVPAGGGTCRGACSRSIRIQRISSRATARSVRTPTRVTGSPRPTPACSRPGGTGRLPYARDGVAQASQVDVPTVGAASAGHAARISDLLLSGSPIVPAGHAHASGPSLARQPDPPAHSGAACPPASPGHSCHSSVAVTGRIPAGWVFMPLWVLSGVGVVRWESSGYLR